MILAKAQAFDLVLPLQQVLGQVLAMWSVPVPDNAMQRLAQLHPSPAEAAVFQRLTKGHRPVAQRFWDDLSSLPDWRSRAEFALPNLFPTPAYMRERYDLPQSFPILLSYPYRWAIGLQEAIAHRS